MDQSREMSGAEGVSVQLTEREWNLILEYAFVAPEVEEGIRKEPVVKGMATVLLSASDLEGFVGWMAAATNHAGSRSLMLELSDLCDHLEHLHRLHKGGAIKYL